MADAPGVERRARQSENARPASASSAGFSLIELIIVIVIIGIIAAIAIPRMSSGAENAKMKQLRSTTVELDRAITLYAGEHNGRSPAHEADGSWADKPAVFLSRLMERTDEFGATGAGVFGPYLRSAPINPYSECSEIRTNGAAPGTGCGWRFDTDTLVLLPDHTGVGAHAVSTLFDDRKLSEELSGKVIVK